MAAASTTTKAAKAARTRMDELRELSALLEYGDVARVFGVKVQTVRRWAHAGRLARDKRIAAHYRVSLETVRQWRKQDYDHWKRKASRVDLNGVGVNYHALPEPHSHYGLSDVYDRDAIIAWGLTDFEGEGRTRLTRDGTAVELVPRGRPPGVAESRPRPPRNPERVKLRDKVVKRYAALVKGGSTDSEARATLTADLGISRKEVSRLLVEARAMPETYGEIPVGAAGGHPRSESAPRRFRISRGNETRTDVVRKVAARYAELTEKGYPLERIKTTAGAELDLAPKTIEKMVREARANPETFGELPPPAGHRNRRVSGGATVTREAVER